MRLLNSPLLHSLSFGIFNISARAGQPTQLEQYSKLPELREILLNTPGLKKLDIGFKFHWKGSGIKFAGITEKAHVLNIAINQSDRLPSLHELILSGPSEEAYEFDKPHCELLRRCMDWSQLRRLDIGISCPQHLFEEVSGSLSSLKSLKMGIRVGSREHWRNEYGPMTSSSLENVTRFIEAVPGLHELIITDLEDAADTIAANIVANQKSLHKLAYLASIRRRGWQNLSRVPPNVWRMTQLLELKDQCPTLSYLEINMPLEEGRWVSTGDHFPR